MTGFRLVYLGAAISLAVGALARTSTFVFLRYVIDQVIGQGKGSDRLYLFALGFVGLAAIEGLSSYLRGVWAARTAEGVTLRLRNYLLDHIQRLSFTYHDHVKTGDLIERATSDVEAINRFYADQAAADELAIGATVHCGHASGDRHVLLVLWACLQGIRTLSGARGRLVYQAAGKPDWGARG
jgi:ABC-type multidrug transport system fused ATPase/permease subunit